MTTRAFGEAPQPEAQDCRSLCIRVIRALSHGVDLAEIAVEGPDPEAAARYLLASLDASEDDIERLRAFTVT